MICNTLKELIIPVAMDCKFPRGSNNGAIPVVTAEFIDLFRVCPFLAQEDVIRPRAGAGIRTCGASPEQPFRHAKLFKKTAGGAKRVCIDLIPERIM